MKKTIAGSAAVGVLLVGGYYVAALPAPPVQPMPAVCLRPGAPPLPCPSLSPQHLLGLPLNCDGGFCLPPGGAM